METEISDWVDRQKQLYAIIKLVLKKGYFSEILENGMKYYINILVNIANIFGQSKE